MCHQKLLFLFKTKRELSLFTLFSFFRRTSPNIALFFVIAACCFFFIINLLYPFFLERAHHRLYMGYGVSSPQLHPRTTLVLFAPFDFWCLFFWCSWKNKAIEIEIEIELHFKNFPPKLAAILNLGQYLKTPKPVDNPVTRNGIVIQ